MKLKTIEIKRPRILWQICSNIKLPPAKYKIFHWDQKFCRLLKRFSAGYIHHISWMDGWKAEARCSLLPCVVIAPTVARAGLHSLDAGALGFHFLDLKLHFDTVR